MKVKFDTSVSFAKLGGIEANRVVEVPEELAKPFLDRGIASQVDDSIPYGTKITGPVPDEFKPKAPGKSAGKKPAKAKATKEENAE